MICSQCGEWAGFLIRCPLTEDLMEPTEPACDEAVDKFEKTEKDT